MALEVLSYVGSRCRGRAAASRRCCSSTRVYSQAISQIADAEVRLVHLYVHEPLMRSGGSAGEMADAMLTVARGCCR